MLAAQDQENLVHGQQAAAAAKPLNQGIKQLPPKTPRNPTAKTPLKVPLNDENRAPAFGAAKKTGGKGDEHWSTIVKRGLSDQSAFVTPKAPQNRAPLGVKTTNAKAKTFQTPAPPAAENEVVKTSQKSASTRKPKPKAVHSERTKLEELLADKEALDEREVEYMPPPAQDLPDIPDDIPLGYDYSGAADMRNWYAYYIHAPDAEGLSYVQREEIREKKESELLEKKLMAKWTLDDECVPWLCTCYPECTGPECVENVKMRRAAEEKYRKTMAELEPKTKTATKKPVPSKGPSVATSRSAASALSQPKRPATQPKPAIKSATTMKKPVPTSSKGGSTPAPTNPSSMRHTAAAAASKTTMGYSKGRTTSAALRKPNAPAKSKLRAESPDKEAASEEDLGPLVQGDDIVADWIREQAEKEFVLDFE
ncbi:MAG: hypothetical protein Q9167_004438 [Letrouitia subvulpina]